MYKDHFSMVPMVVLMYTCLTLTVWLDKNFCIYMLLKVVLFKNPVVHDSSFMGSILDLNRPKINSMLSVS